MTRRIDVSQFAKADADSIYLWLRSYSEPGAERWWSRLRVALSAIGRYPERSAIAPEADFLEVPIREQFFRTPSGRNYRIIFSFTEEVVQILRIRTPGQDYLSSEDLPSSN